MRHKKYTQSEIVFFAQTLNNEFSRFFEKSFSIKTFMLKDDFKELEIPITFHSINQYLLYTKALVFNDTENMTKIMKDKLGIDNYEIKNYDAQVWLSHLETVLFHGNLAKFSQNVDLKTVLIKTLNKYIAETNPFETIFGIGLLNTDEDRLDSKMWEGLNLNGKSLMKVREKLLFQVNVN